MKTIEKMSTTTKVLLAGAAIGGIYLLTRKPKKTTKVEEEPEIPPGGLGTTGPEGETLFEFNVARSQTPEGTFYYAVIYSPGVISGPDRVLTRIRTNEQGNRFLKRRSAARAARLYIQTVLEGSAVCIGGCPGLPKGQILPPIEVS